MELYSEGFSIAALIARVFLGIMFASQGYSRLFKVGSKRVAESFGQELAGKNYPQWFLYFSAYSTAIAELVGGLLLIFGLLREIALIILSLDLLLVTLAFSIMQPILDLEHIFPRLLLLLGLWLVAPSYDVYSVDHLLRSLFHINLNLF